MDYISLYEKYMKYENDKKSLEEKDICCPESFIIRDNETQEYVCINCGNINKKDAIVSDSEINNYDYLNIGRENTNILLPKSSLLTFIRGSNPQFRNLKQIQLYHRPTEERGLWEVFKKIDTIFLKNIKLPKKIKNDVKYYYKLLCEDNEDGSLTRGEIRNGIIIACIYIALKNNNRPININELSKICNIKKSTITKGMKRVNEIEKKKNIKILNTDDNIHYYIHIFCNKINLGFDDIEIIHLLYERAVRINIIKNNTNKTICVGLIYLYIKYMKLNIDKKVIIKSMDISQVTLIKIYNLYNEYSNILFIGL